MKDQSSRSSLPERSSLRSWLSFLLVTIGLFLLFSITVAKAAA